MKEVKLVLLFSLILSAVCPSIFCDSYGKQLQGELVRPTFQYSNQGKFVSSYIYLRKPNNSAGKNYVKSADRRKYDSTLSFSTETKSTNSSVNAHFTYSPTTPLAGHPVFFDASESEPQEKMKNYKWDFGDGSDPTQTKIEEVQHTYSLTGQYVVTLVVTTLNGYSDAYSQQIEVKHELPKASFTYTPQTPDVHQRCKLWLSSFHLLWLQFRNKNHLIGVK